MTKPRRQVDVELSQPQPSPTPPNTTRPEQLAEQVYPPHGDSIGCVVGFCVGLAVGSAIGSAVTEVADRKVRLAAAELACE